MKIVREFRMDSDNRFSKVEQRDLTRGRNLNVWKFVMIKQGGCNKNNKMFVIMFRFVDA